MFFRSSSAIENIVTTQDELYKATTEEEAARQSAKEVLSYREALYAGLRKMQSQNNLLLTSTLVDIVRTIKQDDSGIRKVPGTALKNAITGAVIYTPPCCEDEIRGKLAARSEEHTSELQSLMRISYAGLSLEKRRNTRS